VVREIIAFNVFVRACVKGVVMELIVFASLIIKRNINILGTVTCSGGAKGKR
jgi:hypothetical protein